MENEARYFQTFEVIHEGVWDWDIDKGKGFASDNFFSIIGAENKDFTGLDDLLPWIHPEDHEQFRNQVGEGITAGSDFDIQTRLAQKRDDYEIHILIRGRVIDQDADGKALRMLGTVSDITDQKKAEEDLRESESKFRAVFHNNHAVMLLIDPETGAIIDANPAACHFYGYSQKQLISMKISDINTLKPEEIKTEMQHAARESRTFFNFRHRLAKGDIRDVEVFSGPIAQKNRTLLFSIIHDVTARKQAEKALVENENRLRFALEGANDGLWTVNLETDEMGLSPRGCEILGYTADEYDAMKMTWDKLVHQEDHPATARKMEEYINGLGDLFEIESRMHMKTGDWKWVLTRGKALERGPDGHILTMTGTLTDISRRKQSEEKMLAAQLELKRLLTEAESSRQVLLSMLEDQKAIEEQLNQMNINLEQRVQERTLQLETINNELEAFSYSVSHDLRAPLRGIDGWSLALVEDYGEQLDENARDYLSRVRNETQRMGQLIDDLLRLSRVTRMGLIRGELNLSVLASAIVDRLRVEYKDKPPVFLIEPNITAHADSQLMDIVLTNLLSNACKFSAHHDSPQVEFGTIHINDRQAFYVRDNGVGFDSANAKKLFGAFQRMHRQSDFPGSGIGLATVKRIINRHGGQVWAESQKDRGATFYFTLPEVQ
jgi:PAS domain S-box-containing protein